MLTLVLFIIVVALVFDFINGFHDAANSIATVVSTRVLTPLQAVVWAAFFNFVAAFGFGVNVARTVGKGVVESGAVDAWVAWAPRNPSSRQATSSPGTTAIAWLSPHNRQTPFDPESPKTGNSPRWACCTETSWLNAVLEPAAGLRIASDLPLEGSPSPATTR